MATDDRVLVTGASGFIAKHCIVELLRKGYRVRGTVRRPQAASEVVDAVSKTVAGAEGRLETATADLTAERGWNDALAGCRYLLHVASPFPMKVPADKEELIAPARDGTLRVLAAAAQAGVERTVLTSSLAAVYAGHRDMRRVFTESDWSDIASPTILPYPLSKTLAERAAWDFLGKGPTKMELAAVCPGFVLGPALDRDIGTSAEVILLFLRGAYPAVPRVAFTITDARDVAAMHIAAMTSPAASGERFICASGPLWLKDIGRILLERFPEFRRTLPTRQLPDALVRIAALFDSTLRPIVPELGKLAKVSNLKARKVLGMSFREPADSVTAMARSLIDLGLVSARR
jgi:dihydroflavonol-4-reductase